MTLEPLIEKPVEAFIRPSKVYLHPVKVFAFLMFILIIRIISMNTKSISKEDPEIIGNHSFPTLHQRSLGTEQECTEFSSTVLLSS
jgi:hypothetical protein